MTGEDFPQNSPLKYECISCNYTTSRKNDYKQHILTLKHKSSVKGEDKEKILRKIYHCEICSITMHKQNDYNRHISTSKHKNNETNQYNNEYNKHKCDCCNKIYSSQSNLWKHKKKCSVVNKEINTTDDTRDNISTTLFMEVIKQSKELQNVLVEQTKELQNKLLEKDNILIEQNKQIIELAKNQSTNINSHNTNNNQFNLQFYLNETCKDAMNIVDFVNSLQLTTDDFETTGKLGFVDGISRIFIKELKKIDTEKLPIHCTDFKRETVYIKDNNTWEKENDEKKKLKWTIDRIAKLNYNQIQQWQEKFPECRENNTPANEHFFRLTRVALGGYGKEEADKFRDKIMKNVLKEVVLDKKQRNIQSA